MHAELKDIIPIHKGEFVKYYNFVLSDGRNYEVVSRKDLNLNDVVTQKYLNSYNADAVDIIAFSEDFEKVLVVKEWRVPVNTYVYAFPAGLREPSEDILETAKRELFEETGLKIENVFDILPPAYQSVGMTDEAVASVICSATGEITNKNETINEDITPVWITKQEARQIVIKGPISGRCQMVLSAWSWDAFFSRK